MCTPDAEEHVLEIHARIMSVCDDIVTARVIFGKEIIFIFIRGETVFDLLNIAVDLTRQGIITLSSELTTNTGIIRDQLRLMLFLAQTFENERPMC